MNFRFKTLFTLFAPTLLALFPLQVAAQTTETWLAGYSNDLWIAPGAWSGDKAPGSGTNAVLNNGSIAFQVDYTGTADNFYINTNTPISEPHALIIQDGTLVTANTFIGNTSASNSEVDVSSGALITGGTLTVGSSGTGDLALSGGMVTGSAVGASTVCIGFNVGSTGTVTISGSGILNETNIYLGYSANSAGTMIISNGSLIGGIYVGNSGVGTLTITGGTFSAGYAPLNIGYNAGSSGTVNMSTGTLNVILNVQSGTGTLNLNGGTINFFSGNIGTVAGSYGLLNVASGTFAANSVIYIGPGGTGVVSVNGGYFSDLFLDLAHVAGGNGSVSVTSGTLSDLYETDVGWGGTGNLLLNGGMILSNTNPASDGSFSGTFYSNVGFRAGSTGTAAVQSGTWLNGSDLAIGSSGTGILSMSGGYVTSGSSVYVGYTEASSGTAVLTGGTLAITGQLVAGNGLPGAFTTSNTFIYSGAPSSGLVTINGALVTTGSGGVIGNNAGSTGVVTVTSGSWVDSGSSADSLIVGNSGTGTLNINGSGVVTVGSGSGTVIIASGTASVGTLNLGDGGTLNAATVINKGTLAMGNFGNFLSLGGSYSQTAAGSLNLTINTTGSYDAISVGGLAVLGGTLNVSGNAYGSGANPEDSFTLITGTSGLSGTFSTVNLPTLQSGQQWYVAYNPNSLVVTVYAVQSLTAGSPFTYTATPPGPGPFTYQWSFNGSPIGSATNATYSADAASSGIYSVVSTGPAGSTTDYFGVNVTPAVAAIPLWGLAALALVLCRVGGKMTKYDCRIRRVGD